MLVQRDASSFAFGWAFWLTTLILVASAVLYFLPSGWLSKAGWRTSSRPHRRPARRPAAVDGTGDRFALARHAAVQGATPLPALPAASTVGAGGEARKRPPVMAGVSAAPPAAATAELK